MLKPGGLLLYVTCSILLSENDGSIEKFIRDIDDYELQSVNQIGGEKTRFGKQRLPGVHPGDGFYFCSIGKTRGQCPGGDASNLNGANTAT
jgi:16S rRNA (cytosine967-C5)-methyltransferase